MQTSDRARFTDAACSRITTLTLGTHALRTQVAQLLLSQVRCFALDISAGTSITIALHPAHIEAGWLCHGGLWGAIAKTLPCMQCEAKQGDERERSISTPRSAGDEQNRRLLGSVDSSHSHAR